MICGQLFFGLFGDALGRHKVYGKELIFTIIGTLLLICAPPHLSHEGIVAWMAVFRVMTGMGTGGGEYPKHSSLIKRLLTACNLQSLYTDYPMTSSISAESSPLKSRSTLILTIFSNIGLGGFSAAIVYIILLAAFKGSISHNINHLQWVWRLLFGIGIVPLILTLYARLTMKESKPYEKYVATETGLVGENKRGPQTQLKEFREYFSSWKHARTLFAVSACWFLL